MSNSKNNKRKAEKLQRLSNAWENLRPAKTFAGMTLTQFQAKVQPSLDSRTQAENLGDQLTQARATRNQSDSSSYKLVKLVVNAINGDPDEGEDGPLYSALGYVPESARLSGLTRKGQTTPAVVTNASETTTQTVAAK